jgi:hypothetical protein
MGRCIHVCGCVRAYLVVPVLDNSPALPLTNAQLSVMGSHDFIRKSREIANKIAKVFKVSRSHARKSVRKSLLPPA